MPTPMPLKTEISDTYPNPSDAVARAGFAKLWDYIATLYGKENVIGPVSQAAGVPTGKMIETGTNANGRYIRFADGTQICFTTITYAFSLLSYVAGLYAGTISWTFPAAFYGFYVPTGSGTDQGSTGWINGLVSDPVSCQYVYYTRSASLTSTAIYLMAVGRWY